MRTDDLSFVVHLATTINASAGAELVAGEGTRLAEAVRLRMPS